MKLGNILSSLDISLDNLQTNNISFLEKLKKSFLNKNYLYIFIIYTKCYNSLFI